MAKLNQKKKKLYQKFGTDVTFFHKHMSSMTVI